MIITEYYMTRPDGVVLNRTYSNRDLMILQEDTGAIYSEAIDPISSTHIYVETDTPIEPEEEITDEEFVKMIREVL